MKNQSKNSFIALANGTIFYGTSRGVSGISSCELVFNTSISGYQEVLFDPSYNQQAVCFTFPHIGIVGCNPADQESSTVQVSGIIARSIADTYSSCRAESSLKDVLQKNNTLAIDGIDTRAITRLLRDNGVMGCTLVANASMSESEAITAAQNFGNLDNAELATAVTTTTAYPWDQPSWQIAGTQKADATTHNCSIGILDLGCKANIARIIYDCGAQTHIFPATTSVATILDANLDALLFSNGPGDPSACKFAVELAQQLGEKTDLPLWGICLGHQILGLAFGAEVVRLPFGHHGSNHPVIDLKTQKVHISSQNHNYALHEPSLLQAWDITHKSLFDNSVQGIAHKTKPYHGFQGHPEASPGPADMHHWLTGLVENLVKQS